MSEESYYVLGREEEPEDADQTLFLAVTGIFILVLLFCIIALSTYNNIQWYIIICEDQWRIWTNRFLISACSLRKSVMAFSFSTFWGKFCCFLMNYLVWSLLLNSGTSDNFYLAVFFLSYSYLEIMLLTRCVLDDWLLLIFGLGSFCCWFGSFYFCLLLITIFIISFLRLSNNRVLADLSTTSLITISD